MVDLVDRSGSKAKREPTCDFCSPSEVKLSPRLKMTGLSEIEESEDAQHQGAEDVGHPEDIGKVKAGRGQRRFSEMISVDIHATNMNCDNV